MSDCGIITEADSMDEVNALAVIIEFYEDLGRPLPEILPNLTMSHFA